MVGATSWSLYVPRGPESSVFVCQLVSILTDVPGT